MPQHPFHVTRWQTAFAFPEKNGTLLPFLAVKCQATIVPSIPCLVPSQVFLKKGDKIKWRLPMQGCGFSVGLCAPYSLYSALSGWHSQGSLLFLI